MWKAYTHLQSKCPPYTNIYFGPLNTKISLKYYSMENARGGQQYTLNAWKRERRYWFCLIVMMSKLDEAMIV